MIDRVTLSHCFEIQLWEDLLPKDFGVQGYCKYIFRREGKGIADQ